MAARATVYDADQVVIYFNGVMVDGFADGEFFTVTQMSKGFSSTVGSDGEVARSKSSDRRATVMVKLLQTSLANKKFSDLHNQDMNAPNGAGIGTFMMQDLQGDTIVQGAQAWIVGYPDNSMDRTAKSRDWEIEIANADRTEGGNATV